ncbi:MAG: histidinol dehydrogenase [Anaerolineae bacterium]
MLETGVAIRILNVAEAQATILRREAIDHAAISPAMAAGIRRVFGEDLSPAAVVDRILADVRQRGDAAVREYTRRIDGVDLADARVSDDEMEAAWAETPQRLRDALARAVERIHAFHEREPRGSWIDWRDNEALGQIVRPIERVGLYVPAGASPLPSSLLMAAIPARVAGVEEIVLCTPPDATGRANATTLAAARLVGITRAFKIGGAQAVAALAYGTESVPAVDKIVGPGNPFVVLAQKAVFGTVGIANLPGPTETLLIADDSANPAWTAADLLAQSEHVMGTAILLTSSRPLAEAVGREIAAQVADLRWRDGILASLAANGGIVITDSIDQALDLANAFAPEHLCLLTRDPWRLVGRVRHAGGIFVGEASSEALGDYIYGPSHIMPTSRTARFTSPIHVRDFLKVISVFGASLPVHNDLAPDAIEIAEAEGLTAHAAALRQRLETADGSGADGRYD